MKAQKNEVTVNTSYFTNELAMKPEYQNQYGNGFNQNFGWFFSNWGPSFDEAVQQVGVDNLKLMVQVLHRTVLLKQGS